MRSGKDLASSSSLQLYPPEETVSSTHGAGRAGVDCHHWSRAGRGGDPAFLLEDLVKCFPQCDITGPNTKATEAYVTWPRSPTWKELDLLSLKEVPFSRQGGVFKLAKLGRTNSPVRTSQEGPAGFCLGFMLE